MPKPEQWARLNYRMESGQPEHYLNGECLIEGERLEVTMPAGFVTRGVYARDGLGWDGPCLVYDSVGQPGVLSVTPIDPSALCRRGSAPPE